MTKSFGFILSLVVGIVLLAVLPALAEVVDTAWVRRYDGPASDWDVANAIAVDGSGNVYVTGKRITGGNNDDYFTIKYDPSGNQLWSQGYHAYEDDYAYAIAVDGSGNVYVTGASWGSAQVVFDYATIKYSPSGNQLWAKRYDGPAHSDDFARAIAVDGSGNVCVTGNSWGGEIAMDYCTIKYYPNGDTAWVRRYNGSANLYDYAHAIAVDGSGNIYVTGLSYGSGTYADYATIKYDLNGNQLWVKRYNGPGNSTDEAYAIEVDGSGNVYVTGSSMGSGTYMDYATIKYHPNGDTAWVRRYNGPANYVDRSGAIAVDGAGNVYVTGSSWQWVGSGTDYDYATIKYDPNGNQLWVKGYNGSGNSDDVPSAIATDGSGNVYVTGGSAESGTSGDYCTIKYYPNGDTAWVRRYNGPGNSTDGATAIATDGSGNVYVTGRSTGSGTNYDYATIKYYTPDKVYWEETGDTIWIPSFPGRVDLHMKFDNVNDTLIAMIHPFTWEGSSSNVGIIVKSCDNLGWFAGSAAKVFDYKYCSLDKLNAKQLVSGSRQFEPRAKVPPGKDRLFAVWSFNIPYANSTLCLDSTFMPTSYRLVWGNVSYDTIYPAYSKKCWIVAQGLCGDANIDGIVDIGDIVYLINYVFYGGPEPQPNLDCNDVNSDGIVDIGDIVYLINYVFYGGPAPSC